MVAQSERRIRAAIGGRVRTGHVPDAEVSWPDLPASPYPGECWAIEAELTPKPLARTTAIMTGLLDRAPPTTAPARPPMTGRVMTGWSTWPARPRAASSSRAAASLPGPLQARVTVRDLPPEAVLVTLLGLPAVPAAAVGAARGRRAPALAA